MLIYDVRFYDLAASDKTVFENGHQFLAICILIKIIISDIKMININMNKM